jgi:hypothetical protein
MALKRKWIKKYTFILILFLTLLIFGILISTGIFKDPEATKLDNLKFYLLLLGAMLTVVTFIFERMDKIYSRRIDVQLGFFDRWQKIRSKIEKLKNETSPDKIQIQFNRYFELLSLEHLMNIHISKKVSDQWNKSRILEFKDKTEYSGKTFAESWDGYKDKMVNEEFKGQMEKYKKAAGV